MNDPGKREAKARHSETAFAIFYVIENHHLIIDKRKFSPAET